MKVNELVKHIADREGLSKQVSIGNIREIVGIISDLVANNPEALKLLIENGIRRSKKK